MIHDLHSHSLASDGTLTPRELVTLAAGAGVQVLALTDHDETAGIAEAAQAADELGIRLVPGVEVSVTWERMTIHVVGLNIDPEHPMLDEGLERLRAYRNWRAEEIGRRLAKHGVRDAHAGARALARGRIVSRTHFAHYLVSQGFGRDTRAVFQHFLRRNKPGHVPGEWAGLEEAVGWIRSAGGVAVIAHPARYDLSGTKLRRLIAEFMDCGGEAMEVVSGSHSREDNEAMAAHVRRTGMLASAGSDFHGPENPWVALGRLPELPVGCPPVWESDAWLRQPVSAAESPERVPARL
jgi:predicted metal-dependent phosphoesterase TrpH